MKIRSFAYIYEGYIFYCIKLVIGWKTRVICIVKKSRISRETLSHITLDLDCDKYCRVPRLIQMDIRSLPRYSTQSFRLEHSGGFSLTVDRLDVFSRKAAKRAKRGDRERAMERLFGRLHSRKRRARVWSHRRRDKSTLCHCASLVAAITHIIYARERCINGARTSAALQTADVILLWSAAAISRWQHSLFLSPSLCTWLPRRAIYLPRKYAQRSRRYLYRVFVIPFGLWIERRS